MYYHLDIEKQIKIIFEKNKFTDFSIEIERRALREICSEARQQIWKTDKNVVFVVGGKELKSSACQSQDSTKKKRKRQDSSSNSSKKSHSQLESSNDSCQNPNILLSLSSTFQNNSSSKQNISLQQNLQQQHIISQQQIMTHEQNMHQQNIHLLYKGRTNFHFFLLLFSFLFV